MFHNFQQYLHMANEAYPSHTLSFTILSLNPAQQSSPSWYLFLCPTLIGYFVLGSIQLLVSTTSLRPNSDQHLPLVVCRFMYPWDSAMPKLRTAVCDTDRIVQSNPGRICFISWSCQSWGKHYRVICQECTLARHRSMQHHARWCHVALPVTTV